MRRTGYALSGLVILFMLMDATMKLMGLPIVTETTAQLGWPVSSPVPLAIVLLVCTALYAVPRTRVLGAVLLTGYLGGAIATHVLSGGSFAIALLLGVLAWLGLYLREARLHALLPLRR